MPTHFLLLAICKKVSSRLSLPCLLISSLQVPLSTICPFFIIITVSQSLSTSFMLCEANKIVIRFLDLYISIYSRTKSPISGSKLAVGSSRNKISGLLINDLAKETGVDRIELYTESYASHYEKGNLKEINKFIDSSLLAHKLNLGVNAGHDLNLENIQYFVSKIPYLDEVSIGHAIISESLYLGIDNVINLYLQKMT